VENYENRRINGLNNQCEEVFKTTFVLTRLNNATIRGLDCIGCQSDAQLRKIIEKKLGVDSLNDVQRNATTTRQLKALVIDLMVEYKRRFEDSKERTVTSDDFVELLDMLDSGKTDSKYNDSSDVNEVIESLIKQYETTEDSIERGNGRVNGVDGMNAQMMQYFKNATSEIMSNLENSIYSTKIKLEKQEQSE